MKNIIVLSMGIVIATLLIGISVYAKAESIVELDTKTTQGNNGCSQGDLNGDGVVNVYDLSILLRHYGQSVENDL